VQRPCGGALEVALGDPGRGKFIKPLQWELMVAWTRSGDSSSYFSGRAD
jgi:hypothetical protein